jgi:hypothetical protein
MDSIYNTASAMCSQSGRPIHVVRTGDGRRAVKLIPAPGDTVLLTFKPSSVDSICEISGELLGCPKAIGGGKSVSVSARADLGPDKLHELFQVHSDN